jgi:predicted alpha/beta hydrolase
MNEVPATPPRELTLRARDGYALAASVFEPLGERRSGTLLVNSATAVPRGFYRRFATFVSERGLRVVTYDYRGVGGSLEGAASACPATMQDWGRLDFAGAVDDVERLFPGEPVLVLGHSVGGQLLGLADNATRLRRIVLVAAQDGYWKLWPRPTRYAMAALWVLFVPLATALCSELPAARFGFGENLPPGVAREWARWCRSPAFFVDPRGRPLELGFAALDAPLRAYDISDDLMAPLGAVDRLLARYERAHPERVHVSPELLGARRVGHFGFFRPAVGGALWPDLVGWLDDSRTSSLTS